MLTDGWISEVRVDKASPAGGWRAMHVDIALVAFCREVVQARADSDQRCAGFTDLPLAFLAGRRAVSTPFRTCWAAGCEPIRTPRPCRVIRGEEDEARCS